ncbi:hypothetical protein GA0070616_4366 [Micromonospora nigra]|uniref:Uncharacterized protein n=1 Tax=Micromonospora nigra TaxID=145857 RepID=A0A1C6SR40_9ACTN|nr:hypothetical protein [Micromonospora nigra]SCL31967.1 hypothetical protein GA0070616_4366 [Micromonospora nigra]
MVDVGGTVRLRHLVRDAAGDPADPATATLRIQLPDGTVVTPGVTLPSDDSGLLEHDFVTTAPGRHVVSWTTTDPATAYADVVNVVDSEWTAIVGLADAKRHLNIPATDTTDDEELRGFILSASAVVEDVVGIVARRTVTETASGGGRHIILERPPVLEVAEVLVDGQAVDAGDYTWSPSGLLARRSGVWPCGLRNVEVMYVAGKSVVPHNIVDATLELIRINWRPQAGGNYSAFDGGGGDDFGNGGLEASLQGNLRLGFFVPNTVIQRLQPDQRGPVVL